MMTLFEMAWRLLPDQCEMPGCCRKGVRGNENIIEGKIVCDYCDAQMMEENHKVNEALHGFDDYGFR